MPLFTPPQRSSRVSVLSSGGEGLPPQPNSSGRGQTQGTRGAGGDRGSLPRGRLRRFRLPTDVLRSAGWSCPISIGVLVRKLSLNFCIRDSTVSCVTSGAATAAKGLRLEEDRPPRPH